LKKKNYCLQLQLKSSTAVRGQKATKALVDSNYRFLYVDVAIHLAMHQLMVAFSENLPYVRPLRKDMLGCRKQNLCHAMTKIFLLQW